MRNRLGILSFVLLLLCSPAEAGRVKEPILLPNRAYVFYQDSCPMCRMAKRDIKKKYLNRADIIWKDVNTKEGVAYMKVCAKKFGLTSIGMPLVCMGDHYFMGWSGSALKIFDKYLNDFYPH